MSNDKLQVEDQTVDFVQKYSYRPYSGELIPRWKRLLEFSWFELKNTWNRSVIGKILLILILTLNFLNIVMASFAANFILQGAAESQKYQIIRDAVTSMVASYLSMGSVLRPSNNAMSNLGIDLGILLIGLFAIAGSGFFADDRQGKVIEVYLSKIQRWEYVVTKIGALASYIFVFTAGPLLILGFIYLQAFNADHLRFLDFYVGIIVYSLLITILLTVTILVFSSFTDKRAYASLSYFLLYLVGTIFGLVIASAAQNEILWIISPSQLLSILALVILGDQELYLPDGTPLILNDGKGLETIHVFGLTASIILISIIVLAYQMHRLTRREL